MILPDWVGQLATRSGTVRAEGVQPLADAPTIVAAALDDVDFLVEVLPHVSGPQRAGLAVEGHPPDVAQPVGPDFRAGAFAAYERVVLGDRIGFAVAFVVHVDAENLAEQLG